jgi:hypothetical protein
MLLGNLIKNDCLNVSGFHWFTLPLLYWTLSTIWGTRQGLDPILYSGH